MDLLKESKKGTDEEQLKTLLKGKILALTIFEQILMSSVI